MDFGIRKDRFHEPEDFSGRRASRHRKVPRAPSKVVDLRTPHRLGGRTYLTAVAPVRAPDSETVHDCVGCRGYVYADEWHLVAHVRSDAAPDADFHFCDAACLREWRRLADR